MRDFCGMGLMRTLFLAVGMDLLTVRADVVTTIPIGFESPYGGVRADSSCSVCGPAFIAAVQWVNENAETVMGNADFRLQPFMNDTSTALNVASAGDLLLSDRYCDGNVSQCGGSVHPTARNVMALIGGRFSQAAITTAVLAELYTNPMVSFAATSDIFSDKAKYPYFSRVIGPDRTQATALVQLIRSLGWRNVGLLTVNEAYGTNFALQFTDLAIDAGIEIRSRQFQPFQATVDTARLPMRLLKESGVRVIVLAGTSADVVTAFRAAQIEGLVGPGYTWLGADGVINPALFSGPNADLGRYASGMLGIQSGFIAPETSPPDSLSRVAYDRIFTSQLWRADASTLAPGVNFSTSMLPPVDTWAYFVWDATVFVARACGRAHASCSTGRTYNGSCVQEFIRNTTLANGATGNVTMDSVGNRPGQFSIVNLQPSNPNVFVIVGSINPEVRFDAADDIVWSDGAIGLVNTPSDGNFGVGEKTTVDRRLAMIASVPIALLLFCGIVALARTQYLLYRERNKPEDLAELQSQLMDEGFGTHLSIGRDQIGFNLKLKALLELHSDEYEAIEDGVLQKIQNLPGLPRYIAAATKTGTARVVVSREAPNAVLVIPRGSKIKEVHIQDAAVTLWRHALSQNLTVFSREVTDVEVALSTQVPVEMERQRLTRLEVIGDGNFGEVFRGVLSTRNVPDILIAIKSLKIADTALAMLRRRDLLQEAAIVALFDHQHIVRVLGVVTIPRDIPPLLLFEFCDGGNLLETVQNNPISVQEKLTFGYEVCLAMCYLSTRRIVHRDVAARNVLLNSQGACKLADFGMAAKLKDEVIDVSDYSSDYVKLRGEMAVRWSAVEILRESKYSRASDVWSFGVLMFELMSDGAQPYSDFPSLQALSEAVVNGHRLSNPRGCSAVVFARLLEPCWHVVPAERPGFRKLQEAFLDLGVIAELPSSPTSITENSTPDSQNRRPSQVNGSAHRVGRAESENIVMDEKKLLGASVHHLSTVFAPEVYEVVGHDASIRDAVSAVVKPNCACKVCPHDGGMGSSYVDSLVGDNHVGMSNALLSYTWAYRVVSVVLALESWAASKGLNPKETYIWICCMCLNQHRIVGTKTPTELANEFGPRVRAIGCLLPMLEPWNEPVYVTRAWCLFELYTAILERRVVHIEIVITDTQRQAFLDALATEGHTCIDMAFANICSEEADASVQADLDSIRRYIESFPGGFDVLNQTCRKHLEGWFRQHGAVASSNKTWRRSALSDTRFHNRPGSWQSSEEVTLEDTDNLMANVNSLAEIDDSIEVSDV